MADYKFNNTSFFPQINYIKYTLWILILALKM